ncbi:hypothetical protein DFH09DRAFT_1093989 [Mycena vulgaris]|nr:hypothetical protein DFH09DRAFT_1093989 [Mycena vulgaris]
MKAFILITLVVTSGTVAQRSITVFNKCPFTIWYVPGRLIFASLTFIVGRRWEAPPFSDITFSVANNWGRRNCNFSGNPGPNSCLDGGSIGGLILPYKGVPSATLATFDFEGGTDFTTGKKFNVQSPTALTVHQYGNKDWTAYKIAVDHSSHDPGVGSQDRAPDTSKNIVRKRERRGKEHEREVEKHEAERRDEHEKDQTSPIGLPRLAEFEFGWAGAAGVACGVA